MALRLVWKDATTLPVEASSLHPSSLGALSTLEIARLELGVGNSRASVGDLFRIEGEAADGRLALEGDLRRLHGLATGMTSGRLTIDGDVGTRLAVGLSGGDVELFGSAGAWAGAEMRGGSLAISGNAGDDLGGVLPGSRVGMKNGRILIRGAAGARAGRAMRRGLIAIGGDAGVELGAELVAGTIFVFGRMARLAGLGMKRGSIVALGRHEPIPPTFFASGRHRPEYLAIYLKRLVDWGFSPADHVLLTELDRYNGDLAGRGQGEILLASRF